VRRQLPQSAFEKSGHADDWRELMRLFMVRRTRSFVERNYAFTECPEVRHGAPAHAGELSPSANNAKAKEDRRFLILEGGSRFHFPKRQPKTLTFRIRDNDPDDQYARLYSDKVVDTVRVSAFAALRPRQLPEAYARRSADRNAEAEVMDNLSRAGKRLIGFCRTNLFKRLESSGHCVPALRAPPHSAQLYLSPRAGEQFAVAVGTQDPSLFDTRAEDHDSDSTCLAQTKPPKPNPRKSPPNTG
jgi:hypothetical protein